MAGFFDEGIGALKCFRIMITLKGNFRHLNIDGGLILSVASSLFSESVVQLCGIESLKH
jgi:hypothetical protein